ADRILRHFTNLLKHACSAPETPLSSLSLMDGTEVKELFAHVNQHAATFDNLECLHATFEERVKASPNAPALSYDGKVLTYEEANRRANQIAHYLIRQGIGPDILVAVCLDRSFDLILAILGVLKAGGAYLPIDLSYPPDRLAFMLED